MASRARKERETDPQAIMKDEEEGVFRVQDIGNRKASQRDRDISREARDRLWNVSATASGPRVWI